MPAAACACAVIAVSAVGARAFPLVAESLTPSVLVSEALSGYLAASAVASPVVERRIAEPVRSRTTVAPQSPSVGRSFGITADAVETAPPVVVAESVSTPEPALPVLVHGRTFAGIYPIAAARAAPPAAEEPTPWQLASKAGVGVGSVARKASVGLAGVVTRASVSVAKSF